MVKWSEIREALESGNDYMYFTEYNISETASIWGGEIEETLQKLIKKILESEGLYDPGKMGRVIIPPQGFDLMFEEGSISYLVRFRVYDYTERKILAEGTAFGKLTRLNKERDEYKIEDMTIALPIIDVMRLKQFVEGLTLTV